MDFKVEDKVKINEKMVWDKAPHLMSYLSFSKEYIVDEIMENIDRVIINSGNDKLMVSSDMLIKVEEEIKPKEFAINDVCGRRFKILYKSYKSMKYRIPLEECKLTYIEGKVDNFCPTAEVVLNDDEYGFNIIPFRSIVYMEEIINKVG